MGSWAESTSDDLSFTDLAGILDRVRNTTVANDAGIDEETVSELWRSLMRSCCVNVLGKARPDEPVSANIAIALGEQLAADGRSLTNTMDMLMALRRLAMEAFRWEAQAQGYRAGFIARGIAHISRLMTQFMVELNRGHLQAEIANRARRRMEQDIFVWQSLTGTSPGGDDFIQLDAYGLDGSAAYHAFRARPVTDKDMSALESHLMLETADKHKIGMAMVIEGDVCGFMTELPSPDPPILMGVSDAVPFTELPNAFRRATRAFNVAQQVGLTGLQSLESLGVIASVVADKEIAAVLTDIYLSPMYKLGEYGETLLDTVRSYTANGCQIDTTAQELALHVNTVRYRIAKFEEILGVSLRDTSVLAEVWWALNLPVEWWADSASSLPPDYVMEDTLRLGDWLAKPEPGTPTGPVEA